MEWIIVCKDKFDVNPLYKDIIENEQDRVITSTRKNWSIVLKDGLGNLDNFHIIHADDDGMVRISKHTNYDFIMSDRNFRNTWGLRKW